MEMGEIIFTLKEIVRELNPDVIFVPKYGGELIELIPNNEKSRIGGIFAYSDHVTLEFSQGFRMDLGAGFLEGNGTNFNASCHQILSLISISLL